MKCPICGDEFTPKRSDAKVCAKSACRKKNQRLKLDKPVEEIPVPSKAVVEDLAPEPKPDLSYRPEPGLPEWYIHGPERAGICVRCGVKFKTTLPLMRFCSEQCKSEVMIVIANGPHEAYLKS